MQIKSDVYKNLIAINHKKQIVNIPNKIMRKLKWVEEQEQNLTPNSVCIVCNFSFKNKTRGWSDKIKAICHPFKNTDIFPNNKKLYLFSESDFCDDLWMPEIKPCSPKTEYKYEFFYFAIGTEQGVKCKGYYSLPIFCKIAGEMGSKAIILDYYDVFPRPKFKSEGEYSKEWVLNRVVKELKGRNNVDLIEGVQTQEKITELMEQSRYVIFPNTMDASPRTIPETLIRGKPVLVNKGIYGGWKYVNEKNGLLFDAPSSCKELDDNYDIYYKNIKDAMLYMREHNFDYNSIRSEHLSKYGFINSSKFLANIINEIEGKNLYTYVMYREFFKMVTEFQTKGKI